MKAQQYIPADLLCRRLNFSVVAGRFAPGNNRRGFHPLLAPWDPPKHLVVQDFYRFNRNPMYVGVVMLVLGWAFLTGNLWNYVYSALIPVIFHLRVVL